jgi:hypothetical protein
MKKMIANIKDSPTGVKVPGDLIVDGTITPNKYELDQDIAWTSTVAGLTAGYSHIRISNGKLNIVLSFSITGVTSVTGGQAIYLTIPAAVGAKLYPIIQKTLAATCYPSIIALDSAGNIYGQREGFYACSIGKDSNTSIYINMYNQASGMDDTKNHLCRFEFNFILS